jgi:hypothetical protein
MLTSISRELLIIKVIQAISNKTMFKIKSITLTSSMIMRLLPTVMNILMTLHKLSHYSHKYNYPKSHMSHKNPHTPTRPKSTRFLSTPHRHMPQNSATPLPRTCTSPYLQPKPQSTSKNTMKTQITALSWSTWSMRI